METSELLLSELNANAVAIKTKEGEINSFISEKTSVLANISNAKENLIPNQEKKVNAINLLVKAEYTAYNTRVTNAKNTKAKNIKDAEYLVTKARVVENSKKAIYNSASTLSSVWLGRLNNGCKWTGAVSTWQGTYCGDYSWGCRKTGHNYESDAPNGCLKGDRRKARHNYAKTRFSQTNTAKINALTDYNNAKNVTVNAEKNVQNQINSTLVTNAQNNKGSISAQEKAYQDAKNILKNYTANGGTIDLLNRRILVIDKQIDLKNTEIKTLENERAITEVNYKTQLSKEAQKLSAIENQLAEEQANRDNLALVTEGSVQNALNQNNPINNPINNGSIGNFSQMGVPKQGGMSNVLIIGLLLIGGGYLLMKGKN